MSERVTGFLSKNKRVGLSSDGEVSAGYDSIAYEVFGENADDYGYDDADMWTDAERIELADAMIARWKAFRQKWLR
jgi:hypothetical protein